MEIGVFMVCGEANSHVTCSHGELGVGLGLSRDSAGKYMSRGKGTRDNLGGGRNIIWDDYGYVSPLRGGGMTSSTPVVPLLVPMIETLLCMAIYISGV